MPIGSNSAAQGAAVTARAGARLAQSIADYWLPEAARLDEELRYAIGARLAELVGSVEVPLRRQAARLLAADGDGAAAEAMLTGEAALARLSAAGLLRDPELMDEVIGQVHSERIARRLPPIDGVAPGLLLRLLNGGNPHTAAAARALLAVDGRRPSARSDLPAELQHRLVWWVAAAVRPGQGKPATDRALVAAARRWLVDADEEERAEALAFRLTSVLDPPRAQWPSLLLAALADGRLSLFNALLARGLAIDLPIVRAMVLEPEDDSLWWALRAAGLGRDDSVRIALALAGADPRRDVERLADRIDAIGAADVDEAQAVMAPLMLTADYRSAIEALAAGTP